MQALARDACHAARQRFELLIGIRHTVAPHDRLDGLRQHLPVAVEVFREPRLVDAEACKPLRQRKEDVLALARRFLEGVAKETNRRLRGFAPEAETALTQYSWPGNVRELRNVVERRLLLKTNGDRIERDDLALGREAPLGNTAMSPGEALPEAVRVYEKELILDALRVNQGNVARAASSLGISRTNLHNKLRKHDLMRSQLWDDISHD